jgi:hypothetical protein
MRKYLSVVALFVITGSLSACTEACEDACEQQHNAAECLQSRPEAECTQVAEELLTCVQACNE